MEIVADQLQEGGGRAGEVLAPVGEEAQFHQAAAVGAHGVELEPADGIEGIAAAIRTLGRLPAGVPSFQNDGAGATRTLAYLAARLVRSNGEDRL